MYDGRVCMFVGFGLWNWMGGLRRLCRLLVVVVVDLHYFLVGFHCSYYHHHSLLESVAVVVVAYDSVDGDVLYLVDLMLFLAVVADDAETLRP